MRTPRRRPPWWPEGEAWPPEGWPKGGAGPAWGLGWGGGGGGLPFLVAVVVRAFGFLLLSIALVTLLGYVGAAVVGVATAPIGVLLAGLVGIVVLVAGLRLAWRAFRRAGRPLERLVAAAGRVEAGDYTVRVPEDGAAGLRSLARAFNQMSARLEEGDAARRSFLVDVSHELRTPITIIRGQVEAITDGIYPADAEHLRPIMAQTALLERLVEDLRTVSLAESGALQLRREPVDLVALARNVTEGFMPRADAAGLRLRFEAAGGQPAIAVDPALIRRVLANLVTNALRHTPAGGEVIVMIAADGGMQRLTITDTGPGIPAELRPRIFERFVRGPGSDGSGLGLAIARDLVAAHGGSIRAEDAPGGGARLVVELPAAPAAG